MRHGKKNNHLGRTDSHRKAMLSNMASSLIMHKRINTTVAKAKALRIYVEPLLTKSKTDSTHNRRVVFSYLQDKESVTVLFREVATKIADRQGGYTRIIKTGARFGDNAEMCFIELVDYNEVYNSKADTKKAKTTRRGRNAGKAGTTISIPASAADTKEVKAKADHSEKSTPTDVVEHLTPEPSEPIAKATETNDSSIELKDSSEEKSPEPEV